MANSFVYSVGAVVLILASMLIVVENADTTTTPAPDPCQNVTNVTNDQDSCLRCVKFVVDPKTNCTFVEAPPEVSCTSKPDAAAQGVTPYRTVADCVANLPNGTTTTTPASTTTSTTTPTPSTTTTTQKPTTTTTPVPTTTTTTLAPPTPPTTNGTTTPTPSPPSTTTVAPTNGTTPTVAPRTGGGGMSFASFFGGIVFTLCCSGLGYLIWRFYRARVDQNYHTFSNPTF